MSVSARLLGAPGVRHEGDWLELPAGKTTALLYYLACRRGVGASGDPSSGWIDRNELLALLWGELSEERARSNLRKLLSRSIRDLPFADSLDIEPARLRWRVDTDLEAFRAALDAGRWREAVECYRGEFLQGVRAHDLPEFEDWCEAQRQELAADWRHAVFSLAAELATEARHDEAAAALARLHRADPLDEEVVRHYLRALQAAGQPGRARTVFDLFATTLERELGGEPDEETRALVAGVVAAGPSPVTPAPRPSGSRRTLPVPPTPFVGRELEKAQIAAQLDEPDCRLVTLVAPGGIGKTRLALAVAEEQLDRFEHGVCFVSLAGVASPDLALFAVADALGLRTDDRHDPKDALVAYLRGRRVLLVLDNLEHLPELASLIADLLVAAPGLKILATSRERLHLRAEWVMDLRGLLVPDESDAAAEAFDAVRLFAQHARRQGAGFEPGADALAAVVRICRLVEGMPLALELAASWLRVLTPDDIAAELERGIDLLEASTRDAPERHRSIRAVFDASWEMLSDDEKAALRTLAAFHGGFGREAAVEVAGARLPLLAALVDKSFLSVDARGRYRRHPLIYQYTRHRLETNPDELRGAQERHGAYYHRFLQSVDHGLREGRQKEALEALDLEWSNVQVAWAWAVAERRLDVLRAFCEPLEVVYVQRNRFREGVETFTRAAASLDPADPAQAVLRGRLLVSVAWLHFRLGNLVEGKRIGEQAVEPLRRSDDRTALMEGLNTLGAIAGRSGRYLEAECHFDEALAIAEAEGDYRLSGYLNNLAIVEKELGDFDGAERRYRRSLALNRRDGNHLSLARGLNNLASLLLARDRLGEAEGLVREGLELAEAMGFEQPRLYLLANLGDITARRGDPARGRALLEEALAGVGKNRDRLLETEILRSLGRVDAQEGRTGEALDHLRRSLATAWSVRSDKEALATLAELAVVLAGQGDEARALGLARLVAGHEATDRVRRDAARALIDRLRSSPVAGAAGAADAADAAGAAGAADDVAASLAEMVSELAGDLALDLATGRTPPDRVP